jgi:hypothetical protein
VTESGAWQPQLVNAAVLAARQLGWPLRRVDRSPKQWLNVVDEMCPGSVLIRVLASLRSVNTRRSGHGRD